jgi:hypothetical protein
MQKILPHFMFGCFILEFTGCSCQTDHLATYCLNFSTHALFVSNGSWGVEVILLGFLSEQHSIEWFLFFGEDKTRSIAFTYFFGLMRSCRLHPRLLRLTSIVSGRWKIYVCRSPCIAISSEPVAD